MLFPRQLQPQIKLQQYNHHMLQALAESYLVVKRTLFPH
jgi:hypothetical protein